MAIINTFKDLKEDMNESIKVTYENTISGIKFRKKAQDMKV